MKYDTLAMSGCVMSLRNSIERSLLSTAEFPDLIEHFMKCLMIWDNTCSCGKIKKWCECDELLEIKYENGLLLKHWNHTGWLSYEMLPNKNRLVKKHIENEETFINNTSVCRSIDTSTTI